MESSKKKRQSIMDIWRVMACIFVLAHHSYLVRDPGSTYFMYKSMALVDLFFIVTGYFTASHFIDRKYENVGKESVHYYVKKFASLLPYTTVAILLQYIMESREFWNGGIKPVIGSFYSMPLEMLFLTETYTQVSHVIPMWYLSALFVAFPVFLLLLRIKDKYMLGLIGVVYSSVFYNAVGIMGYRTWPKDPFRALAGLLAGTLIFIINSEIKESGVLEGKKHIGIFVTLTEIVCFIIPFTVAFFNFEDLDKISILLIVIGVWASTSGYSASVNISSRFVSYLGKLTMPVYIWQWPVGTFLAICFGKAADGTFSGVSQNMRLLAYYILTIVVSILSFEIIERVKGRKKVS